jgi:hypothetical protein
MAIPKSTAAVGSLACIAIVLGITALLTAYPILPITTGDIADGAVTREKIAEGVIPGVVLENDGVLSQHIAEADGTTGQDTNTGSGVKTGHIQDGAVVSAKIADGTITATDISSGAITTEEIADGTIGTVDIGDDAVTADKMGKMQAYAENERELSWTTPGGWTWMTFPAMSITITTTTTCDVLVLFDHCVSSSVAGAQSRVAIIADGTVVAISAVNTPTAREDWYQTQALHTTLTDVMPGTHTYYINWGTPDAATFHSARRHMSVLALPAG